MGVGGHTSQKVRNGPPPMGLVKEELGFEGIEVGGGAEGSDPEARIETLVS